MPTRLAPTQPRGHRGISTAQRTEPDRHGFDKQPGEDVRFVVVDVEARSAERVRLSFKAVEEVDVAYYTEQLLRATESVVSPLGWMQSDIDRYRRDRVDGTLSMY